MRKYLKIFLLGVVLLALVAAAIRLSGTRRTELKNLARPEPPVYAVYVDTAETGALFITRAYLGIIEPVEQAGVAFRIAGHLLSAAGDAGDTVAEGEIIATIDARPLKRQKMAIAAELEAARSEFSQAKTRVERRRPLLEKGLIDPEAMAAAESALVVARARVDNLKARLAAAEIDMIYTTAPAPFDGVITTRHKHKGDLVMPGEPVYTIENPGAGYKVVARIPRETALLAVPGSRAKVTFDSRKIETTLHRILPATGEGRLAMAEIRLAQRPFGLPSGTFVAVDLLLREEAGLLVPVRAILEDESGARVFRVDEHNRVNITGVTVLGRKGGQAVIEGPVSPGDRLVIAEESMLLHLAEQSPVNPMDMAGGRDIPL